MKKWIYIMTLPLVVAACGEGTSATSGTAGQEANRAEGSETYAVDQTNSTISWHGEKALVDGQHNGTVGIKFGELAVNNGHIQSGNFSIDMQSLSVTDEMDPEWKAKLLTHLKGDEFFSVDTYPEARFAVVSSDQDSITANLTIKGITRSIKVPYAMAETADGIALSSDFQINRAEWNVQYGSGSFFDDLGDNLIRDEVDFKVRIIAKPN